MTKRIKRPGAKGGGKAKGIGNRSDNYEVGYGKPPVHSQFQKGTSGNSRGKPKGRKNTKTMIRDITFAPIEIQVQGKVQKITAYEAMLMKLRQAALGGDFRSTAQMIQLAQSVDDGEADERSETEAAPFDRKTFNAILRDYLEHSEKEDAEDDKDAGIEDGEAA
jgi:hypothetical protein